MGHVLGKSTGRKRLVGTEFAGSAIWYVSEEVWIPVAEEHAHKWWGCCGWIGGRQGGVMAGVPAERGGVLWRGMCPKWGLEVTTHAREARSSTEIEETGWHYCPGPVPMAPNM